MSPPPRQPTGGTEGGPPGRDDLALLFMRYLDGLVEDVEEVAILNQVLSVDSEAQRLFVQICYDARLIDETLTQRLRESEDPDSDSFFEMLAALDIADESLQLVDVTEQLEAQRAKRRMEMVADTMRYREYARKWGHANTGREVHRPFVIPTAVVYSGLVALLACIVIVGYSFLATPKKTSTPPVAADPVEPRPVVATIDLTMDALWDKHHVDVRDGEHHLASPLRRGAEIREGDRYKLTQGTAQFSTGRGAILVIEAPSEIEFIDENRVLLTHGKVVGKCLSPQSEGLRVQTPTAEVIDLGTEFGVQVDRDGVTNVVTFDGKVQLREVLTTAASQPASVLLVAGRAGSVNALGELEPGTQSIDSVDLHFVRNVEKRLDVADMVGGGDGLGAGQLYAAINYDSGELIPEAKAGAKTLNGRYVLTKSLPLVDGVFIPDGGEGPVQVNSRGDLFDGLRDTGGKAWLEVSNGGFFGQSSDALRHPRLGGIEFGNADNPSINIHANAGITFDLNAIRRSHPALKITGFSTLCGVSETAVGGATPLVDFLVLLDGRVVYRNDEIGLGEVDDVDVVVPPTARFLTAIVTDGGNGDGADWFLLARPELILEPVVP